MKHDFIYAVKYIGSDTIIDYYWSKKVAERNAESYAEVIKYKLVKVKEDKNVTTTESKI